MTILIKGGAGLLAGVFVGGLGICFWPHAEPNLLAQKSSVEKPVFVVSSASSKPASAPPPVQLVTSSVSPPADKAGLDKLAMALKSNVAPDPKRAAAPAVVAAPVAPAPAAGPSPAAVNARAALPAVSPSPAASTTSVVVASTNPTVALPHPNPPSAAPAAPAVSDEARSWSGQGLLALADGDLASARLFLQRAADAGDSRALMALAETYNPDTLARLGVVGAHGDPARARDYLARAVAAGVGAAKDRIAALDAKGN